MKAFPSIDPIYKNDIAELKVSFGMDLRDYFAAKAMQADISNYTDSHQFGKDFWSCDEIAKRAYNMADAMMKVRQQ